MSTPRTSIEDLVSLSYQIVVAHIEEDYKERNRLREILLDAETGALCRAWVVLGASIYKVMTDAMNADPLNNAVFGVVFSPNWNNELVPASPSYQQEVASSIYSEIEQPRGNQPEGVSLFLERAHAVPTAAALNSGFDVVLLLARRWLMVSDHDSTFSEPVDGYLRRFEADAIERLRTGAH